MNTDYVLKGRGQITLHQPDWAKFTPSSGSSAPATEIAGEIADSPLPTEAPKKADKKTAAHHHAAKNPAPTTPENEPVEGRQVDKTRMNEFTHSGSSKKSVGPDVDTVDYTFEDFLDTINPLQQIPVVNMIYRHLTGDKISGVAQVMGSALFWGPTGIITGAVDAIFEQEKGGDMGETIMASLLGTETPNAKNLPSNNPIKNAPEYSQETMLAEAEDTGSNDDTAPVAVAAAKAAPVKSHKLASKLPFGGVMGNEQPASVANVNSANVNSDVASPVAEPAANDDVAGEPGDDQKATAPVPSGKATAPVQHAPIMDDGKKLYSLAGIVRHVGSPSHMPIREVPDTRLKAYGKMNAQAAKPDPATLLVLQKPSANMAGAATLSYAVLLPTRLDSPACSAALDISDLSTPSGNPIPAQLIQDMMLMNMQKYQNDIKNGTMRGSSLDVNG